MPVRYLGEVEFGVLGSLIVKDGKGTLVVSRARERALLCYLLMHANAPLADDVIIDALWGENPPSNPKGALQTAVSRLRTALNSPPPDSLLQRAGDGYVLAVDPEQIDANRFERLVDQAAEEGDTDSAIAKLDNALAMWRGSAYADVRYEEFAQPEIWRLDERRVEALETRISLKFAAGRHRSVIAELEALVHQHPLRESLWALLMRALHRSGRQAEALRVYQRAATAIGEQTGLDPGIELAQLEEAILLDGVADPAPATEPGQLDAMTNMPTAQNPFVGRQDDLERVGNMLESNRLVTLVGPAGVGKTRLAQHLAASTSDQYSGGVFVIALDKVGAEGRLVDVATAALSLPQRPLAGPSALADVLRSRRTLMILDNCEHVLQGAAELVDWLLGESPTVRIIATSRQRLGVGVEQIWNVDPLPTEPAADDDTELEPATELFLVRMSAVRPDLDRDDPGVIAAARQIARSLDGLPLAIELAASQCFALTPHEVAAQLDERMGLPASRDPLVSERHQTLHNAVGWSLNLLSEAQLRCFLALSVVPESFGTETVTALCESSTDWQSVLTDLVEQSLIQRVATSGRAARFRLLSPVRAIAQANLEERGELRQARKRYVEFLTDLAAGWYRTINGPQHRAIRAQIREERWNLLTAVDWTVRDDPTSALILLSGPRFMWVPLGHRWTAIAALQQALSASPEHTHERANALNTLALLSSISGYRTAVSRKVSRSDLPTYVEDPGSRRPPEVAELAGRDAAAEAALIAGELGDTDLLAFSQFRIGFTADPEREDPTEAAALLEHAVEELQNGDLTRHDTTSVLIALSRLKLGVGAYAEAERLAVTALEQRIANDHITGQLAALDLLGRIARAQDNPHKALRHYQRALALTENETISPPVVAYLRTEIAYLAMSLDDEDLATRQLASALTGARRHGYRAVVAAVRVAQAQLALSRREFDVAHGYLEEALGTFESRKDVIAIAYTLATWGLLQLLRGDLYGATELFVRSIVNADKAEIDPIVMARAMEGLAAVAVEERELERAATLLGAAGTLREAGHTPARDWIKQLDLDPDDELDADYEPAFAAGRNLSRRDALAFATRNQVS